MRFLPHVTVATIVEDAGRFLMVEEYRDNRIVLNQPAGHLEADESLIEAARREVLEETAWNVDITGLVGIYLFKADNGTTYQRTCFHGRPRSVEASRILDDGILRAVWMTPGELEERKADLRSPLVLGCVRDFLNKPLYSLDIIR